MLFPHLLMLAVLVLLAVYLPFARIVLGVWVLWYASFGIFVARTLRRRRRGITQSPTLWLTSDSLGFTNRSGVTVSCPRSIVVSALRIFATVNRKTQDLLVFRDDNDNVHGGVHVHVQVNVNARVLGTDDGEQLVDQLAGAQPFRLRAVVQDQPML